jgi:isopentenyl phosphate kinase
MTGELIVLKWGGGLITHKSDECSPDLESIAELSKVVNTLISEGNELILVHGAGSYGQKNPAYLKVILV